MKKENPKVQLTSTCPCCGSRAIASWIKAGYQLFACSNCEHIFCDAGQDNDYIETVYGDDYFEGGGGGYSDYLQHQTVLVRQGAKYAGVLHRHVKPGRLLNIGSAAGFIQKGFEQKGWASVGVEPNRSMAEFAKNKLGVEVIHVAFEDLKNNDTDLAPFDAATLIQVISHLREPVQCLQQIHGLLRPHGLLLIETWNRKSITARVFGKKWHQYNPPSVLHWYTKKHLKTMLENAGFKVIEGGRPTKWISLGNGVSLIRHSLRDSTIGRIAASPLAMIPKGLRVPYFMDDVFWFVAQKVD